MKLFIRSLRTSLKVVRTYNGTPYRMVASRRRTAPGNAGTLPPTFSQLLATANILLTIRDEWPYDTTEGFNPPNDFF